MIQEQFNSKTTTLLVKTKTSETFTKKNKKKINLENNGHP